MCRLTTTVRAASRMVVRTALEAATFWITFGANGRTTVPSGLTISRTIWGWYSVPPFASAEYAFTTWSGVARS